LVKKNMKLAIALAALLALAQAGEKGVDVSSSVNWSCLKSQGIDFGIIRGYESSGNVDSSAKANVAAAKSAGIDNVDLYFFPCVSCGNPANQAAEFISAFKGVVKRVWLDIEIYQWSSNQSSNQQFILELVSALGKSFTVGIYTNLNNWSSIVGQSWSSCSSLPLWYAHYDNTADFDDFQAFGGWTDPYMKQYEGDATLCSDDVDMNWTKKSSTKVFFTL